jgi:hypothetical protein
VSFPGSGDGSFGTSPALPKCNPSYSDVSLRFPFDCASFPSRPPFPRVHRAVLVIFPGPSAAPKAPVARVCAIRPTLSPPRLPNATVGVLLLPCSLLSPFGIVLGAPNLTTKSGRQDPASHCASQLGRRPVVTWLWQGQPATKTAAFQAKRGILNEGRRIQNGTLV